MSLIKRPAPKKLTKSAWLRLVLSERGPKSSKAVLAALLLRSYGSEDGSGTFPGQEHLAACGRVSRRTMQYALLELAKAGWIKRLQRGKSKTTYIFKTPWGATVGAQTKGAPTAPYVSEEIKPRKEGPLLKGGPSKKKNQTLLQSGLDKDYADAELEAARRAYEKFMEEL